MSMNLSGEPTDKRLSRSIAYCCSVKKALEDGNENRVIDKDAAYQNTNVPKPVVEWHTFSVIKQAAAGDE